MRRLANLYAYEHQPEPRRLEAVHVVEALRAARAFVAKGWSPSSGALNDIGQPALPDGPSAVRWNIGGALAAAYAARQCVDGAACEAAFVLRRFVPEGYLYEWNAAPGRTQAEVLALFDRAIAELGGDASAGGGPCPSPFGPGRSGWPGASRTAARKSWNTPSTQCPGDR